MANLFFFLLKLIYGPLKLKALLDMKYSWFSAYEFLAFPTQHKVYMKESDVRACVLREITSLCDS